MFLPCTQSAGEKNRDLKTANCILATCVCKGCIIMYRLHTWQSVNIWERHWQKWYARTCVVYPGMWGRVVWVRQKFRRIMLYQWGTEVETFKEADSNTLRQSPADRSLCSHPQGNLNSKISSGLLLQHHSDSDTFRTDYLWKWWRVWSGCFEYTMKYRSNTTQLFMLIFYYCTRATCFDSYRIIFRPF